LNSSKIFVETFDEPDGGSSYCAEFDSGENAQFELSGRWFQLEQPVPGQAVLTLLDGEAVKLRWGLRHNTGWSPDAYLLLPAAAYNGNRFTVAALEYPPFLHEQGCEKVGHGPRITDVPRLEIGTGPSKLELLTGDLAFPLAAAFHPGTKQGWMVTTGHCTEAGFSGVSFTESDDRSSAMLELSAPGMRSRAYSMANTGGMSPDAPFTLQPGGVLNLRWQIEEFPCIDIRTLFRFVYAKRGPLFDTSRPRNDLPFSAAFDLIEAKYHQSNWNATTGYWMVGDASGLFSDWQAGWVGGGMSSLALLASAEASTRERSRATMDAIFGPLQAPTGFVYPMVHQGKLLGDDFQYQDKTGVLLLRKNADLLLFCVRFVEVAKAQGEAVPAVWLEGIERLVQALVGLWQRHGRFDQFVDLHTGEPVVAGSSSAAIVSGALAAASALLNRPEWLAIARESALDFARWLELGYTNGGPGEILQCPDSESAFGLLETYMELFERTVDRVWLPLAEAAAHQCATWVVSYDFDFPATSEFGRLDLHSTGSVWANVQNKHSAPGICTLSGVSLLKLYRATGDASYLKLLQEIAHGVTQYLSRPDRPVQDWDGGVLAPGVMCERVNLSDWEGTARVGGVFNGSCWCEVSSLLTFAEVPGVYWDLDSDTVTVLDHVTARLAGQGKGRQLELTNPTTFPARVTVLAETASDRQVMLGSVPLVNAQRVELAAGQTKKISQGAFA